MTKKVERGTGKADLRKWRLQTLAPPGCQSSDLYWRKKCQLAGAGSSDTTKQCIIAHCYVLGHCTAWTRLLWELNFLIWDSKALVWLENIPLLFQWHSEIRQEELTADEHSNFQHRKYHDTDWKSRDQKHKDHDGLCNLSLKWHLWTTSSQLNANQWSAEAATTLNNT